MEHTARGVDAQRLDRVPTTPGAITRLAFARAREAGIALEPLLQKAGLTVRQAEDLAVRLPARAQIRFLELAATALEDEFPTAGKPAQFAGKGYGGQARRWRDGG